MIKVAMLMSRVYLPILPAPVEMLFDREGKSCALKTCI